MQMDGTTTVDEISLPKKARAASPFVQPQKGLILHR